MEDPDQAEKAPLEKSSAKSVEAEATSCGRIASEAMRTMMTTVARLIGIRVMVIPLS
ncbi:MAG: hypothetical protein U0V56_10695 [Actinomycetota bacterium]